MNPLHEPGRVGARNNPALGGQGSCLHLLLLLLVLGLTLPAASREPARARHGMVVSTDPLASEVGVEILRKGGHAVDAAVAVGFALAVVHPAAGNLGGGGFMLIHDARLGTEVSVDYREKAPAAARPDMYLDDRGEFRAERSTVGHLASAVPGSVAGLHLAWRRYGRLSWAQLLEPAIRLAREGFPVSHELHRSLKSARSLLERFPESRRVFLRHGDVYQEGEWFRQPELAQTLEEIAREGPGAFYRGTIAAKIVREMQAHGGLITREDLAEYQAVFRPPVSGTYREVEVISMGPPSSGGVVLLSMLHMIEPFPVRALGRNSSELIHLKAEVMRRAFADRARYLGDPDFQSLPVAGLLSRNYARDRGATIRGDYASVSQEISPGHPHAFEPEATTHYSIVDEEGNAVAATTTLNGSYGSGVTIPEAGFLMNNEMDDFTARPGTPNMYGLIQGEANAIAPGKRPLSAMTPTFVKKKGRLFLVLGSPGGPTIINNVFQVILEVVDFGRNIQQAVDNPRIHHQWLPDELVVEEDALVRDVRRALEKKGHVIRVRPDFGGVNAILVDAESGWRLGAADPRRNGAARGY